MKKFGILIAAITLLGCAALASGQEARSGPGGPPPEAIHYGWADVLRVDPVYDENEPSAIAAHEECYDEQVEQRQSGNDNRAAGTVIGAVVGGVLGHSVGKGSGRSAATAAGIVAGRADAQRELVTERRCRTVADAPGQRHVVGYDVEYRYRGELYTARLGYDPGDRLRVRVAVTPVE
jgi:uncharacterized protein YcfJ